jgi:hypothetical protein
MIDKALIIIFVFYALGFMMIGLEYSLNQVYHVNMVSPITGADMDTSSIVGYLQTAEFNEATNQITTANFTGNTTFYSKIETFTTGAAFVGWELIGLMSGTYIFNIMLIMGIPLWFVTAFIALYILLLSRTVIGYIRGI